MRSRWLHDFASPPPFRSRQSGLVGTRDRREQPHPRDRSERALIGLDTGRVVVRTALGRSERARRVRQSARERRRPGVRRLGSDRLPGHSRSRLRPGRPGLALFGPSTSRPGLLIGGAVALSTRPSGGRRMRHRPIRRVLSSSPGAGTGVMSLQEGCPAPGERGRLAFSCPALPPFL